MVLPNLLTQSSELGDIIVQAQERGFNPITVHLLIDINGTTGQVGGITTPILVDEDTKSGKVFWGGNNL